MCVRESIKDLESFMVIIIDIAIHSDEYGAVRILIFEFSNTATKLSNVVKKIHFSARCREVESNMNGSLAARRTEDNW